ncbi:formin-like protein 4 [Neltuma alba]|uniref:formin-like protein 4 n=1 Tax=Neltuma alba TaxID=207710 RepID=UPI0010A4CFB1|nr:formin-like protein 4 [Prosopis alba]
MIRKGTIFTDSVQKNKKFDRFVCDLLLLRSSAFMASSNVKPWLCLSFLFVLHTSLLAPICNCQPQNIETFFPPETSPPAPPPSISPPPSPAVQPIPTPVPAETTRSSSSSNSKVGRAVAITAASTVVVSALVFFFIRWCLKKRRRDERRVTSASEPADGNGRTVVPQTNAFERIEGNVKGLIVDENGLDVIYWRKLEEKNRSKKGLQREVRTIAKEQDQEQEVEVVTEDDDYDGYGRKHRRKKSGPVQEIPLLRGKSSASEKNLISEDEHGSNRSWRRTFSRKTAATPPPPPVTTTATVSPPLPPPPAAYFSAVSKAKNSEPPPPPHHVTASSSSSSVSPPLPPPPSAYFSAANKTKTTEPPPPPPPPSIPDKKGPAPPPPPPPAPAKKSPAPPPAPPMAGSSRSSSKPPPTPVEMSGEDNDKVKLKPLHWDKVTTNVDHSMVWDKLNRGSFRVDQDLMEALFGYVATSKRTKNNSTSPTKEVSAQSSTTFILDSRKSQNIAIVLRSLAVSRREILDALDEGQGLNSDIIEKLVRVAPTQEEQSEILDYNGDPARLAVAESFLYDILKAVPSAFKRLNAMLFRFNYDSEVLEIKESLNTLELACKELRTRGLFVKLLEAVLKAGNRMNAGTSRGNAQAFNLTSLRKLSDVKSTDGKTTLLHFVVEEVVRSEGKRCVLNRDWSLNRSGSRKVNNKGESENSASDEQREMEYLKLGLPFVGGISTEFSNVKKAAIIDYNSLVASISSLSTRIAEIKQLVSQCGNGKGGNFVREMDHFLRSAEEELRSVKDEQTRVMQIVKKTTEYYQGGASKEKAENLLEIFVIIKDFLGMVDQACIDIARNMQKRKKTKSNSG